MNDEDAETYSVRIWRAPDSKRILKVEWRDDEGALHKPDGPAVEEWAPSGELVLQEFFRHGKRHREDGPASITWDPKGHLLVREVWSEEGRFHREGDLPALIERDPITGVTVTAKFYQHGELHRDGGPASIIRDPESGIAIRQLWMQHAKCHRSAGKPAEIVRDGETGVVIEEHYAQNGLWHRESGPAVVKRDARTGSITERQHWLHGKLQDRYGQSPALEA